MPIPIPVNISAVVGENGSGKSTISELIYWINYNLGCQFNLLEDKNGEEYKKFEQLDLQLFYSFGENNFSILKFENNAIKQKFILFENNIFTEDVSQEWKEVSTISDLENFFYSLVVNYSQYALNALEVGDWINPLFHKNDGYQTPIVLNPGFKGIKQNFVLFILDIALSQQARFLNNPIVYFSQ